MQVPSSRQTTFALLALALGGFAIGTTEFVAMGVLPEIAHGIGTSLPSAGHLVSAYALGVVVGAPVLAGLGARFPRRTLLIALMAFYAAANLISAFAPSYGLLFLGRFLSGLPHGAYFGVAALAAADMAPPERRATAMARVMLGLSVANVIGVPIATWIGQDVGWREAFGFGGLLAAITALSVARFVTWTPPDASATFRRELGALKRPQVLLAFATGAIGGAGLFAVYAYISPILTDRAGLSSSLVPVALSVFGIGMVLGNLIGGRVMDRWPTGGMVAAMAAMAGVFLLFIVTSLNPYTAMFSMLLIGMCLMLPTGLQLRLSHVSADAQTLGAALNHSAFNLANALGAWLGGLVLATSLAAPMYVAVAMTLLGMGIFIYAVGLEKRQAARAGELVAA